MMTYTKISRYFWEDEVKIDRLRQIHCYNVVVVYRFEFENKRWTFYQLGGNKLGSD